MTVCYCSVWDDCHSETALFLTTAGNIYCNRMYSDSKICIKDQVNTHWGWGSFDLHQKKIGSHFYVAGNGPDFFL